MKILAVETSCDETGIALVEASGGINPSARSGPRFKILENLVASQIKIHRPFGGVVPNLAKREHLKNLPILFRKIFGTNGQGSDVRCKVSDIDLITVTVGPGLEPALWAGITFAKELSKKYKKPLVGANHLEGHLYSFLLPSRSSTAYTSRVTPKTIFPAMALIVSGGHTTLLHVESLSKWERVGETRDDAVGEAFDKVARMLKLPYPGGPEIEKLARAGNPEAINFPRPMIHDKSYDFSFSGLKTSVLYYLRDNKNASKANIAAGFQKAAVDVLTRKTTRAAKEFKVKSVILCGGVAANKALRKELRVESSKLKAKFFVSDFKYNLDNAAMIAAAGYMAHLRPRFAKAKPGKQGYDWQANLRRKRYSLKACGGLEI